MRGENFLEKFGLIDEKFIEESEEKTKRKNIKIPILIAACFVLILLVAALPFFKRETPHDANKVHNAVDTTERDDITYTPSQVYDGIPYSSLNISDTELAPELKGIYGAMTGDIAPFYEEYIADAAAVVEGRVTDVRIKNYEYTTDYDKFKEGGSTRYLWDTVVYEIEVEKIYKGELGIETLVIEDTILFDSMFYLKEGHRYVLPLTQTTEDVAYGLWQGNITEGSNKKESIYSSLYPYHPGIEITEDGYYLFPDDWTTLASSDIAVKVTMDEPFGCGTVYFYEKMMLIDSVNFEKLFEKILTKYN
ncbi:MAG: hypothetical protein IKT46_09560 [Clostridia bacterium]|nr:hypothetical protein [Clostridia bacterium]